MAINVEVDEVWDAVEGAILGVVGSCVDCVIDVVSTEVEGTLETATVGVVGNVGTVVEDIDSVTE